MECQVEWNEMIICIMKNHLYEKIIIVLELFEKRDRGRGGERERREKVEN